MWTSATYPSDLPLFFVSLKEKNEKNCINSFNLNVG